MPINKSSLAKVKQGLREVLGAHDLELFHNADNQWLFLEPDADIWRIYITPFGTHKPLPKDKRGHWNDKKQHE